MINRINNSSKLINIKEEIIWNDISNRYNSVIENYNYFIKNKLVYFSFSIFMVFKVPNKDLWVTW